MVLKNVYLFVQKTIIPLKKEKENGKERESNLKKEKKEKEEKGTGDICFLH